MKKLMFIATGGTIASGDSGNGLTPEITAEELLGGVSVADAEVHAVQPFALDSTDLTPQHWTELAKLISDGWQDYDGFVIAHGTDTMAYGAAALSCLIQDAGKPIILTGSQLPMSDPDTDARRNLSDAFLCAKCGRAGVWVSFCGRVIAGNAARKVHTRDFDAFRGFAPEDEFTVEGSLTDGMDDDTCTVFYNRLDPSVAVLKLTPGISAEMVREMGTHVRALIIEGFGMGGVPDYGSGELAQALLELAACGVRVIMTTQVFQGGCDLSVYAVGKAATRAGVIPAEGMTTEYAVMRAMWALANSYDLDNFKHLFLGKKR